MRKLFLTLAAAAAMLSTGALTPDADAMTIGTPAGLRGAIEDIAVTDQVHCRPRRLHHRWRGGHPTWNGCYRSHYRRGIVLAPAPFYFGSRVYVGPRRHWRRHW